MRRRLYGCTFVLPVAAVIILQWSLTAQTPGAAKRPLTYDVVDYWRSIQGTRLSHDGQWLAYSLTSQGEDGELVVRNLKSGREYLHARGTGATFSEDGKFCVFTIAQPRAEEEKERLQTQAAEGQGTGAPAGGRGSQATAARNQPRTGLGIMTLADGKVTAIERVGSFRLPEESSGWLAYYKGVGGAGGGGRAGAAGGRGGRGGTPGTVPAAAGGRQAAAPSAQTTERQSQAKPGEKRKDPGSDLILRNLATAEETTIPEVTEYLFDTKGAWLAYATSSTDAAKDGAFARRTSDGVVKTLMTGRGHYKSLTFDEAGRQIAFLSDQADYDKPVSPYRLYLSRIDGAATLAAAPPPATADTPAVELISAAAPGMLRDGGGRQRRAAVLARRRHDLPVGRAAASGACRPHREDAPAGTDRRRSLVDKDPVIQPMQKVRAEQERSRSYRAVVHVADRRFVQLATPDLPTVNPGDDATSRSAPPTCRTAWRRRGTRPTTTCTWSISRPGSPRRCSSTGAAPERPLAGREVRPLLRRAHRALVHLPRRRRRPREPDREAQRAVPAGERHAGPARPVRRRPAGPRTTSRCCSTTSSTSGKSSRTAPARG